MNRFEIPRTQVRRSIFNQIRQKNRRSSRERPRTPCRRELESDGGPVSVSTRQPSRDHRTEENAGNDRHLSANIDPHAEATYNASERKPAPPPRGITHIR